MDETNTTEASGADGTSDARSVSGMPTRGSPIGNDIQKILAEVKLPEQKSQSTSSEKSGVAGRLTFDTRAVAALSGDESGVPVPGSPSSAVSQQEAVPPIPPNANTPPAVLAKSEPVAIPAAPAQAFSSPPPTAPKPVQNTPLVFTQVPETPIRTEEQGELQKIVTPPVSGTGITIGVSSKTNTISSLHTLKEDLQDIVREKKVSLVHAVALEEEKKYKRDQVLAAAPHHSRRSQKTLLIALLFLGLGLLAITGVYVVMRGQASRSEPLPSSIIFSEQTISLKLDKQPFGEVKRNLSGLRSFNQLTLGAITRVMPTVVVEVDEVMEERPATLTEFMNALGIPAPSDITRALGDQFFFGIHVVDENAPVFVMPVISYERAFAAMLAWEKGINANLSPIFTPVSPFILDKNGLLVQRPFEDLVIRNYDVRALRDDAGTIQLYYSFPTRDILIIAESTYSFTEILSRLRAERKL